MDIEKQIEQIKSLAENLLEKLQIKAEVEVVVDEEGAFRVNMETEETGLIIGYHGRTLESFQIILNIIASKESGEWRKIYVNVGDYREKREEVLMNMAKQAAEEAVASGREVELKDLSASERRVVHMTLAGDDSVTTESEGEGYRRVLVIKPN